MKAWILKAAVWSAAIMVAVSTLSGCSSSKNSMKQEETTKLKWYLRPTAQTDLPLIQDEMNKILKEKINAELEIVRIDPGSYDQKLKAILASNEPFDLMFTSAGFGYFNQASRGALKPIDDLVKTYAPKTYAAIPEKLWEAAKVNGKLYGVLNYQIVAREYGFYLDKNLVEKYNFDLNSLKKFEDIEPYLEMVKNGEPAGAIPFGALKSGCWGEMDTYYGFDTIGTAATPGVVKIDDEKLMVINQYESKEFAEYLKTIRRFYQKSYIKSDAAVSDNARDIYMTGKVASVFSNYKPGGLAENKAMHNGKELVYKSLVEPFSNTNSALATLTAISNNTPNAVKAMQLIELMNTDKKLYNLLSFGIEGKHYKKTGENRIEQIPNSGYSPNVTWMFGSQFNAYLLPSQEDDVWEKTKQVNADSRVSKLMGFTFNPEPVKSELAQCISVNDEYLPSLACGSVEIDAILPEYLKKLKAAGCDKVIESKQNQVNEWLSKQ